MQNAGKRKITTWGHVFGVTHGAPSFAFAFSNIAEKTHQQMLTAYSV